MAKILLMQWYSYESDYLDASLNNTQTRYLIILWCYSTIYLIHMAVHNCHIVILNLACIAVHNGQWSPAMTPTARFSRSSRLTNNYADIPAAGVWNGSNATKFVSCVSHTFNIQKHLNCNVLRCICTHSNECVWSFCDPLFCVHMLSQRVCPLSWSLTWSFTIIIIWA